MHVTCTKWLSLSLLSRFDFLSTMIVKSGIGLSKAKSCVCIHTYIHIYIHIYIYIYIYIYACTYVCVRACVCVCVKYMYVL
jgi:hypothetical protein